MNERAYHNETNEPTGASVARRLAGLIASAAMVAAPIVGAAVALAVAAFAWLQVRSLFARLGASDLEQWLAGAASVGVLALCVGALALARSRRLRALGILYGVAWLPLTVSLVALESAFRAGGLIAVPAALASAGSVIAGILAALALLPLVSFIVAGRRSDDTDERAALGYYLSNALKAVLLAATASANVYFGIAQGVDPFVSVFVAVVLETAFLVSLARARDGGLHVLAMAGFGAALSLIAVETLSTLSGLAAIPALAEAGKQLYLLTPAAGILYVVLTAVADRHGRTEAAPRTRILRGMARHVSALREDAGALRQALAGDVPALSSAPPRVTLASDAPADVPARAADAGTQDAGTPERDSTETDFLAPGAPARKSRRRAS